MENNKEKFFTKFFGRFKPENGEIEASKRSSILLWLTAISILIFIVWASLAELDQTVRGLGQVVPSQRIQQIQNLEGGIVQEISVQEGQLVEKDQIVMRIDNEAAGSQYRENLIRSIEYAASITRLEALINNVAPIYSARVMEFPDLVKRQNDLLTVARSKQESELQVLALQSDSKKREANEQKENKKQLLASLALIEKQRELALKALNAKAYSEIDFLEIEQKIQSIKAELAALEHSIPRLEVAALEAEERQAFRKAELETISRSELNEFQIQLLSLTELLTAGGDRVKRTEMRSPVKGVVNSILANTVGGVVAPGATVMEIVPFDDALIIEAKISPADIAFIYPGQKAKVRLTAYDFSIYGGVDATVENISADTLETPEGETFYQVKIVTSNPYLNDKNEELPIMAGMTAEVDIITGKKTIMDYLLKPLLKTQQRAFRER